MPADRSRNVYVAGPSGFSEPGRRYHAEVVLPARNESLIRAKSNTSSAAGAESSRHRSKPPSRR